MVQKYNKVEEPLQGTYSKLHDLKPRLEANGASEETEHWKHINQNISEYVEKRLFEYHLGVSKVLCNAIMCGTVMIKLSIIKEEQLRFI